MSVNDLLSNPVKFLILSLVFAIFLVMEVLAPAIKPQSNRWQHTWRNVMLGVLFVGSGTLVGYVMTWLAIWTTTAHVGMFNLFQIPLWIQIVLGIVVLDFVEYWRHRFSHSNPTIWRVHRVHHSDPMMEASTALRNHPLNWLTIYIPRALVIPLFGIAPITLGVHVLVWLAATCFHHSNIRLPARLETLIGLVFVTPDRHFVHHSRIQTYTDSQFGIVFIFWDKLFHTLTHTPNRQSFVQGLDEFDSDEDQTLRGMLLGQPFKKW